METARNKQTTGLGHVTIADLERLLVCMPKKAGACRVRPERRADFVQGFFQYPSRIPHPRHYARRAAAKLLIGDLSTANI